MQHSPPSYNIVCTVLLSVHLQWKPYTSCIFYEKVRAKGSPLYTTGELCSHVHISQRTNLTVYRAENILIDRRQQRLCGLVYRVENRTKQSCLERLGQKVDLNMLLHWIVHCFYCSQWMKAELTNYCVMSANKPTILV